MIKRILYFILLVALLVGTGAISYILSKQMVNLPDAQAKLQMQAGTASVTIFNDSGTAQPAITVETSQPAPITVGSVITVDGTGSGTLNFAGAQANLAAGGELQVKHYTAQGNEAQIDVVLNRGQISQHIDGYSGSHSYYKIATPAGILTSRNGDFNVQIADNGITYFSATLGTAQITAKEQTITLNSRQGLAIKPGDAPGTPAQWSQVIVPTYRPDGSTVNLPVTLINERTSERFDAYSNRVLLVPPGNYTLKVTAVTTYTLQNLTVTTDQLNELPVTMGEIIFTTTTN